jgi:CheY-like chemotaxis protein/anti-sigma regulatory factor (Ser/Thr protein kinase)
LFSLLGQIESVVGKRAKDKGLGFHLNYDFPLPEKIITDATRLKQILFNLTNNALKFTHSGHISLDVKVINSTLSINVVDTGEGISQSDMQKLFNPFTQADSVVNRQVGGTGLGLSIAKRLAQGLGGDLQAQSQLKTGSTFKVTIKLDTPSNVVWLNTVNDIDLSSIHQITHKSHVPKFAASKVLLADDHPNNRELVALLLKRMNIAVTEVDDGSQAIEAMRANQFDLLLLDIHMPGLNGVDTLKNIRKSGNKTPAIALTANTMQHEIDYYLRIGFTDHLAKPIEREIFIRKVRQYLNMSIKSLPVTDDKMLPLIQGYITDLRKELISIERAWIARDLSSIAKSIHRIKGAAGSFGLANIGEAFSKLEHSALNDDEAGLENTIAQVLRFSHMCIDLPGVDVAQAIVNFNYNLDEYINQLPQAILHSEAAVDNLSQCMQRSDHLAAANALSNTQQLFNSNAFVGVSTLLTELTPLNTHRQQDIDRFKEILVSIRNVLQSLSRALKHNHI